MLPCLAKTRKEEKDERVISLGLHIIRNLLSVKDAIASDTTTGQKEEMSRMQVSSTFLVIGKELMGSRT
jgi:replication fork protection complex subunit Tof1/Swi1